MATPVQLDKGMGSVYSVANHWAESLRHNGIDNAPIEDLGRVVEDGLEDDDLRQAVLAICCAALNSRFAVTKTVFSLVEDGVPNMERLKYSGIYTGIFEMLKE
jgi:hypothetical protein